SAEADDASAPSANSDASRRSFTVRRYHDARADDRATLSCVSAVPVRRERQHGANVVLPRAPLRLDGGRHPLAQHAQVTRRRRDETHAGRAPRAAASLSVARRTIAIEADLALRPDDLVRLGQLELQLHDASITPPGQRTLEAHAVRRQLDEHAVV